MIDVARVCVLRVRTLVQEVTACIAGRIGIEITAMEALDGEEILDRLVAAIAAGLARSLTHHAYEGIARRGPYGRRQ
ncbi:hypothetical protein AQ925_04160 [Burkholderia pseudomallei]|nr:hypothetical protein AQ926_20990 [Burkholderia pseudomallei]ONC98205.1 hypothetical protein AQ925_04160 [Burkholderia pseudomallei]OND23420.1 hypothetical protein AQ930_10230 [Burkholderia pseudomallei]OND25287.1 hypothetical protein AQ928_01620 [Burkholderia pseudomallei]